MGKFKKLLIGLVAGALILVIGFVGALMWMKKAENKEKEQKEEKVATVVYSMEEPIVSNLIDDRRTNVRVKVVLEMKEDVKFEEELKKNDGSASTTIITSLRGKSVAQVTEPDAPKKIGEELTKELNKAYHTDKFTAVYFKEFIVQ